MRNKIPKKYKEAWVGDRHTYLHILLAEKVLGRSLPKGVEVHHSSGGYGGPIVICQDHKYHCLLHLRKRAYEECGKPSYRKCKFCGTYDDFTDMTVCPSRGYVTYYHLSCHNEYRNKFYQNTEGAPLCKCGCGGKVRVRLGSKRTTCTEWNKYIHGHNSKPVQEV